MCIAGGCVGCGCGAGGRGACAICTGGRLSPERRSCAGVVRGAATGGGAGGGGSGTASGRVVVRTGVGGTPVSVGRRGNGAAGLGSDIGGGVGPGTSSEAIFTETCLRSGFGVSSTSGGRACSRMSGGGSLATVRSSSSKKRSVALCSTVLSSAFSSVLSKIWVSSSSSSHPICVDGPADLPAPGLATPDLPAAVLVEVFPAPGGGGRAPTRDCAPATAARRDTSPVTATGGATWRYCSIFALSSSISAAKVFFIHPERSLRE